MRQRGKLGLAGLIGTGLAWIFSGCAGESKAFLEGTFIEPSGVHITRASHDNKDGTGARILVKNEPNTIEFASRFKAGDGTGEVVGFSDSDYNHGIGVNARGKVKDLKLGMALEKKVQSGEATNMAMAFVGRKFGNITLTGGISDINGDDKGFLSLLHMIGRNIQGVGFTGDGDSNYATAVVGRAGDGQSPGYILWGKMDSDNDYIVSFLASSNSKLYPGGICAMVAPDDGVHDPKLFKNWYDHDFYYLWERTCQKKGGAAGRASAVKIGNLEIISGDLLYQFAERKGVSPRVSVSGSRKDFGNSAIDSVSGTVGAGFGKHGYIDYALTDTEGEKSSSLIVGGSWKW